MTKTLTALIAGTFAREGKLALDEPVGLPRWQGTPKEAITWRALLTMSPGLAWDEGYGGASDATQMLFSEPDQGGWAADRPLASEPGTVFNSLWRQPCPRIEPALRARLPEDLVFFAGVMGQFIVIVPSEHLLVLRMGVSLVPHDRSHDAVLNATLKLVADLLAVGHSPA